MSFGKRCRCGNPASDLSRCDWLRLSFADRARKIVQVTNEANARLIMTALTRASAERNIDQGERSWSVADGVPKGRASGSGPIGAPGAISVARDAAPPRSSELCDGVGADCVETRCWMILECSCAAKGDASRKDRHCHHHMLIHDLTLPAKDALQLSVRAPCWLFKRGACLTSVTTAGAFKIYRQRPLRHRYRPA